jgi:hypothetical protein
MKFSKRIAIEQSCNIILNRIDNFKKHGNFQVITTEDNLDQIIENINKILTNIGEGSEELSYYDTKLGKVRSVV